MIFKSKNMHYIYNKEYFDGVFSGKNSLTDMNREIYRFSYFSESGVDEWRQKLEKLDGVKEISLYTIYPGLFIGSGYPHNSGEKETIVGGFFFDQVTGLPVIPGSTLKGMLRSWFSGEDKEKNKKREELLSGLLNRSGQEEWTIKDLENDIFEGEDVFLGGFPVLENERMILASEYITPHKENLKNPTPLSMVKVRPGVKFQFLFIAKDFVVHEKVQVSADEKMKLFEDLLLLGGIGAKTNVGFGQFSKEQPSELVEEKERLQRISTGAGSSHMRSANGMARQGNRHVCQKCGNPVGRNTKTGAWYKYCRNCSNR